MAHLSVVVPVYKAEDCLEELYSRLTSSLNTITADYKIILIEDCGGDRSWEIICELSQRDPRVKGFQFSRNFGQHYGISAGLDHCDSDWVVVMDCDLQDSPEEIPRLYAKAQEGYDVVLARRSGRKDSLFKRTSSRFFFRCLNYLADMDYDADVGNFRIVSRQVVECFRNMRERLRFFGGLVDWMGFPTAVVDVEHAERFAGKSTYTFRKLWKLATEIIIAYSDKPLRLSIKFGFSISGFAFLYALYILYRALFLGSPVEGWSSLIVSIYFIGGIIIAILGILGLYLGKTFDEVKRRPLYIVRKKTG
jgi:glycosyltransferase involved in cell wall biosynthesis